VVCPLFSLALLNQFGSDFDNGNEIMLTVDIPYVPVQEASIVLIAQTVSGGSSSGVPPQFSTKTLVIPDKKSIEYCQDVDSSFHDLPSNDLPVFHGVLNRLGYTYKQMTSGKVPAELLSSMKVSVTEMPKHGTVARLSAQSYFWEYRPEPNYVGKDSVSFLVEVQGRNFKIIVNLLVHNGLDEYADPRPCIKAFEKSSPLKGMNNDPAALIAGNSISSIRLDFSALEGNSLTQTLSTGSSDQLTLDTKAAGYGWHIDYTPYLPTSTATR
jgi:hypothetical protein